MKRSAKDGRWAEVPPARTRFAAEAVFLILVAAGAALAQLSPLSIIGLMLVAWLLVALIERASSREHAKTLAGVEETQVMTVTEPAGKPAETHRAWTAKRLLFWRRERGAAEPLESPTERLEERPSRAHVRKMEPELPPPPVVEPEPVLAAEVLTESPAPGPAVTKRPLELPGLEEPETVRAAVPPPPEPPPVTPPVEPPRVEPPVEPPPVEPPPEPPRVERAPPPPKPPRAPAGPPPEAREWNIWELERQARAKAGDAVRDEEWAALLMHLRQYANADGVLPLQFDGLVRESFPELIQAA